MSLLRYLRLFLFQCFSIERFDFDLVRNRDREVNPVACPKGEVLWSSTFALYNSRLRKSEIDWV